MMSPTLMAPLAAGELGDWMEFAIIAVLIGMSVFGAVAKWLIKQFGGDASGQTPGQALKPQSQQPQPTARPSVPPPDRPRPAPARPVVQAPRIEPRTSTAQPRPPTIRPRPVPVQLRRPQPIQPVRPEPTPQPAREPAPLIGHPPTPGTIRQRHLDVYDSAIDERHLDVAMPSEAVVHPSTEAGYAEVTAEHGTLIGLGLSTRPSVIALRRAIVMSEILGPPLALRSEEQRS